MDRLQHLNEVNRVKIYDVHSVEFESYGRVLTGYDFGEAIAFMEEHTEIPEEGNCYVPLVPELMALPIAEVLAAQLYGGLPIQIGYCNGKNSTYNGFEYHKGSEINVAVTDFMLALGHSYEIRDNHYRNEMAKVFFVEKGTVVEMYQTTLHLSPLRTCQEGFKDIVVLPEGTNTPLTEEEKRLAKTNPKDGEAALLLQRNKWVIAHPDREPLIKQGAFPGIIGENCRLEY